MKRKFFLFTISLILIFSVSFGSLLIVHAQDNVETSQDTLVTDNSELIELIEIGELTSKITEWVITCLIAIFGTTSVAVLFRKQLKGLIKQILEALGLLKTNKETTEKEFTELTKCATDTIKSFNNIKEELKETHKVELALIQRQIVLISEALIIIAGGSKELVVNGSSEKIFNLLQETNKEIVVANDDEKIQ